MMKRLFMACAFFCLVLTQLSVQGAVLTFDDAIRGATSYSFDGDADGTPDVIFTTTDASGFNTAGPGANMTYIQEPGLESTSLLSPDLKVEFLFGAGGSLGFGFALNSFTEDDTMTFRVYDASDSQIAQVTVTGLYTTTPQGRSNFPEGRVDVSFAGLAAYAIIDGTSDAGRQIIDNFEGTFGSSEPIIPTPAPAPTSALAFLGLAALAAFSHWKRLRS